MNESASPAPTSRSETAKWGDVTVGPKIIDKVREEADEGGLEGHPDQQVQGLGQGATRAATRLYNALSPRGRSTALRRPVPSPRAHALDAEEEPQGRPGGVLRFPLSHGVPTPGSTTAGNPRRWFRFEEGQAGVSGVSSRCKLIHPLPARTRAQRPAKRHGLVVASHRFPPGGHFLEGMSHLGTPVERDSKRQFSAALYRPGGAVIHYLLSGNALSSFRQCPDFAVAFCCL